MSFAMHSLTLFSIFCLIAILSLVRPLNATPTVNANSKTHESTPLFSSSSSSSSSSRQANSPRRDNTKFKDQLPRAFGRSRSLQHEYAPKSDHLDKKDQARLTDREQKVAIAAITPRESTPTRSRLPLHRQNSYKKFKDLEHTYRGIETIYMNESKKGHLSHEEKNISSLHGQQERILAHRYGKKASAIVSNPNGPRTNWQRESKLMDALGPKN